MNDNDEMKNELEFMDAMRAYRRAKETGDPEAIRAAEEAWREQVRQELVNSGE